jgi:hypothetical protein
VSFDLLFGFFVLNKLKGDLDDVTHVFDHVLNVVGGLFAIWVDRGFPCSGEMIAVGLGCSELVLDHSAFLSGCKNTLLGKR